MPSQNQPDPNQNQQQDGLGSIPFSPQADLPPMPSGPQTPDIAVPTPPSADTESLPPIAPVQPEVNSGSAAPPPAFSNITSSPKKKFGTGKIIATILGIFVLVGGVAAATLTINQKQLFQQKATNFDCGDDDPSNSCVPELQCPSGGSRSGNCVNFGDVCCHLPSPTPKSGWGTNKECRNVPGTTGDHCILITCPNGCVDGCGENAPGATVKSGDCSTLAKEVTGICGQVDLVNANGVYCDTASTNAQINCPQPKCKVTTPPPNTTPTPAAPYCASIKTYNSGWVLIPSENLPSLTSGTTIYFCVKGTAPSGSFDKARFTINGTQLTATTLQRPDHADQFCQSYTIPSGTTTFTVTGQIHHTTLGWF